MGIDVYEQFTKNKCPKLKYRDFEPGGRAFAYLDLLLQKYVVTINDKNYLCRNASEAQYITTLYNAGYHRIGIPEDESTIELMLELISAEINAQEERKNETGDEKTSGCTKLES